MSLIITTYVREGIVLSSDSRLSLSNGKINLLNVTQTDSVRKTFVTSNNIGISTCGTADIAGVPISGFIDSFIRDVVGEQELNVEDVADMLLSHFRSINSELDTIFHVAGYDSVEEETSNENGNDDSQNPEKNITTKKIRVQRVFRVFIKTNLKVNVITAPNTQGTVFNGYTITLAKILNTVFLHPGKGKANIPLPTNGVQYSFFTLQDAIDFNRFGTQTTIDTMKFEFVDKTVGGPIDILVIEPDGSSWIQKKTLH